MSEWLPGDIDTVSAFDAEFCPDPVPPGYQVAMPYIGGSSAAHTWTDQELARVAHLPRLPIWVPTPGTDDPRLSAGQLVARLHQLGVKPLVPGTDRHVRIMLDLETGKEPDQAWLATFDARLQQAGYLGCPYGSRAWLFGYKPLAGYIVADPTGQPHLYLDPDVVGTQYRWGLPTDGGPVNVSALVPGLAAALWLP